MQHLHEQGVVRDVAAEVLVVEELLDYDADKADFWKQDEQLAELVLDVGEARAAVLHQRSVDRLLMLFNDQLTLQAQNVCN